jgi:hypothetical protein
MHGHLRMIVRTKQFRSFGADGPVTEGRAFGGTGDDADVLRHEVTESS